MGALSPEGRDADILVGGNALGTMLIDVRFCGLVMTREEIDTATMSAVVPNASGHIRPRGVLDPRRQ